VRLEGGVAWHPIPGALNDRWIADAVALDLPELRRSPAGAEKGLATLERTEQRASICAPFAVARMRP